VSSFKGRYQWLRKWGAEGAPPPMRLDGGRAKATTPRSITEKIFKKGGKDIKATGYLGKKYKYHILNIVCRFPCPL